ncbi:velvet factor-domain-containing protein [Podospora appendiculata]|uniref:Velvet factor-domain-containing protein n=1 Tax=Podospora appendiculata TaxID=314037 RepID=A0AAE0XF82_9PEZI|nr:velvet factor-domain-containing protein [Podospora appendiculata]
MAYLQPPMEPSDYTLIIRQQPKIGRVAIGKEKDRKPIDPPPMIELKVNPRKDPNMNFLHSPYLMMTARLVRANDGGSPEDQPVPDPKPHDLLGAIASSIHNIKDADNSQAGFFVFGDLSSRKEGIFRLEFTLFDIKIEINECWQLGICYSEPFKVYSTKNFPGLDGSTFLTRLLSDQGVRLRLRKDSRSVTTRKRNNSIANQTHYRRDTQPHTQYSMDSSNPDLSPNGQNRMRRNGSMHDSTVSTVSPIVMGVSPIHDRARGSMGGQGGYFPDSPQMRNEYGSGSYNYSPVGYGPSEPSSKRLRRDGVVENGTHSYEHDYPPPPYTHAGPRTVPDTLGGSIYSHSHTGPRTLPDTLGGTIYSTAHAGPRTVTDSLVSSIYPPALGGPRTLPGTLAGPIYSPPTYQYQPHPPQQRQPPMYQEGLGILPPSLDDPDGVGKHNQGGGGL